MGMFSIGYDAVTKEKERQEVERSKRNGLLRFFLKKDKDEADVHFLNEKPVNFYEHTLKKLVNGKEVFENVPCIGSEDGCKHCEDGDRPSFKSAWLIVDHREVEFTDKTGKKQTSSDNLRLLVYGTKVSSQLDRKSERYGLVSRLYTIVRLGTGTSTTYTFEHGDRSPLTKNEIDDILPDSVKSIYDGSEESVHEIIKTQIMQLIGESKDESSSKSEVDEEVVRAEDDQATTKTRRGLPSRRKENSTKSIKDILKSNK